MLTPRLTRLAVATTVAVAAALAAAGPAYADHVECIPNTDICVIVADGPGSPGGPGGPDSPGGGGSGPTVCQWQGQQLPCFQDGWGYFNAADGCYYIQEAPPPPAGDPAWEGHTPGDGSVYRQRCFGDLDGVLVWRATPPPGSPGGITPEQLAVRAIKELALHGPAIGSAPAAGGAGLVGLPVWLWTAVTPTTWGPIEASASAGGMTVTAKAQASQIVWSMGDGHKVTCASPGTPYNARYGTKPSPTCGYRYDTASRTRPGGKYTITATTTWVINWHVVGGGATGSLTTTRQSQTNLRIDELQVVTS